MSQLSAYKCTPRQLAGFIKHCLFANLVPMIQSSPGIGKSAITLGVGKELNLKVIDHRLSTSAPEDLSGLPEFYTDENGLRKARFSPFNIFPLEGDTVPAGYDGWLIFLDEFNSASKSVQAASYKLILDRMVGQYKLHERVVIVCAGNLSTDRAIVNTLSTAMQSRMVHLELETNFDDWMMDVAIPQKYDSRIIAFLAQYPTKLMDFRPDHNEKTFCCPRTWEFMNKLVKGSEVTDSMAPLFSGTITSGIALEFITFTKVFSSMVNYKDVIKDPLNTPVPRDNNTKWATIFHLIEHLKDDNFNDIAEYANRFDIAFRILFYRFVIRHYPEMRQHTAYIKALSELSNRLHD